MKLNLYNRNPTVGLAVPFIYTFYKAWKAVSEKSISCLFKFVLICKTLCKS